MQSNSRLLVVKVNRIQISRKQSVNLYVQTNVGCHDAANLLTNVWAIKHLADCCGVCCPCVSTRNQIRGCFRNGFSLGNECLTESFDLALGSGSKGKPRRPGKGGRRGRGAREGAAREGGKGFEPRKKYRSFAPHAATGNPEKRGQRYSKLCPMSQYIAHTPRSHAAPPKMRHNTRASRGCSSQRDRNKFESTSLINVRSAEWELVARRTGEEREKKRKEVEENVFPRVISHARCIEIRARARKDLLNQTIHHVDPSRQSFYIYAPLRSNLSPGIYHLKNPSPFITRYQCFLLDI